MSHRIEAAKSGRAACATCGDLIERGEVRVAELYQDTSHGPQRQQERHERRRESADREPIYRFHHIGCAATAVPAVLKSALNAPYDHALIPDLAGLEAQVAAAVEVERKKRVEAATAKLLPASSARPVDGNLTELLAQLAETPDDATTLQVVGDLLIAQGSAQGELIATQLAIKNAKHERAPELAGARTGARDRVIVDSTTATLIARRDELMSQLAPKLDAGDRSSWGLGFIQRLELGAKSTALLLDLVALWQHPAMPILRELRVELSFADEPAIIGELARHVPRTLRRLEISGGKASLAALVEALPRLEHLALVDHPAGPELAHPRIERIDLVGGPYTDTLARLSRSALPAVRSLSVRDWHPSDEPLAALARTGWLAQLERLHLDAPTAIYNDTEKEPALPAAAAMALRDGLAGKKLARLEVTGVSIPLPVRSILAACTTELVCPTHAVVLDESSTHVEHTAKPEWGKGKIVKRHDGKLEVKFGKAIGVKVFRADAPFLRPVKA